MAGSERAAGAWDATAALLVRRRGWVAAAWLSLTAALLPFAARVEEALDAAARVRGSESEAVEALLVRRFASPFAHYAVLVATGVPSPTTPAGRAALAEIVGTLAREPGVSQVASYLQVPDSTFIGAGGAGTFLVVGLDAGDRPADALVGPLRGATARLTARLRRAHPAVALRWTGEAALNVDLRRTSAADARGAERRVLPVTLLLLAVAFGAAAAALLPVVSGLLAIGIALGAAALLARAWPLSILLQNVVSMLGLGLGIDYALLTVSRFREALAAGMAPDEAARDAARHAGPTIALSGATVAIGFAALLTVPLNELRAVAVGGLLVVTASVLLAVTLLPGVLAWAGTRVDWGRLRRRRTRPSRGRWQRWGRYVAAHPVLVLGVAGAPVCVLAAQARRLSTALPRGDWLPPGMESARALRELEAMRRAGVVQGIRVVIEFPPGVGALEPQGWGATARVARALAADPAVARVRSLPGLAAAGAGLPQSLALSLVPDEVRRTLVSADGRAALVEVLAREGADANALIALVRRVRAADAARLTGVPGARLLVGGIPAFNADYADATARRLPGVVALIVGATLAALLAGFRSLLVALKAVALNLLSVAAAFGAVVLVFQEGHGARWLGAPGALGGIFPAVPLIVFCVVFGLSMDYEVFLVSRVAEARRAGLGESAALAEGLARTGGVITSAAAIMVAVFAAFTLGDFLLVQILGFALAVAVLLDATVVRTAIGPALLRLAGRWNWWPGEGSTWRVAGRAASLTPAARPRARSRRARRASRRPPSRRCWRGAC